MCGGQTRDLNHGTDGMSFERVTPEQRREQYLRLAEKARERALESPATQNVFLRIAESWEIMARSAVEIDEFHSGADYSTTFRRTRSWLRQNAGRCCCDNCLGFLISAHDSSVRHAVRRLAREEGYYRYSAVCDYCGDERTVTRASDMAL